MNTSEDWDVIWKWQWFRRALWQPHYRDPKHPEGRPARTTPMWAEILRQLGATRVLDCNCGLGLRALLLQETGFDVVGTDLSPVAIRHAQELAEFRACPVDLHICPCEELGSKFEAEFDAVINDAVAWVLSREELHAAASSAARALKPGGALVFAGPDQWSSPSDRTERVEHAWDSAPRYQIRANYGHGGLHMTLVVARDREDFSIVETHLFIIHESGAARLETASIRSTMEWTWDDFEVACRSAGFESLQTVKATVGGREHHLNVARR
jgi:SAM-dependent methyltransferase